MKKSNKFKIGQKVWCYYHHTKFFSPPMCGEIWFKWPFRIKHHFADIDGNKDGRCYWYIVKMENNLIVSVPEPCIDDLKDALKNHDENNKYPQDINQLNSWLKLNEWQANRMRYLVQE